MINDLGIIIAAAGSSSRFGNGDKLLQLIDGIPLFLHSVRNFLEQCSPDNMVIVIQPGKKAEYEKVAQAYLPDYELSFIEGASVRDESVRNGLKALNPDIKYVAIHDAARPWTKADLLLKCLEKARLHGGAIPAKPVVDTLKRTGPNGKIIATVDRNDLWRVETPQVFELKKLLKANELAESREIEFTDDASIMEAAGYDVYVVMNPEKNTKITYSKDINR
jgi:2-C-methyl-D-erythritol 4-phosphate cytidylyltransferase